MKTPDAAPQPTPAWNKDRLVTVAFRQTSGQDPWTPDFARKEDEWTRQEATAGPAVYAGATSYDAIEKAVKRASQTKADQIVLEQGDSGQFFVATAHGQVGSANPDIDELEGKIPEWQEHDADKSVLVSANHPDVRSYVSARYTADLAHYKRIDVAPERFAPQWPWKG